MDQSQLIQCLTQTTERSKSNSKRLQVVEQKVDNLQTLTRTVAVLAQQMTHMSSDIKSIKRAVEIVENKPRATASRVFWVVFTALCSAGVSGVLTHYFFTN